MLAAASVCCACTSDLKDRVDVLESKVSALETKANKNAESISTLVQAAECRAGQAYSWCTGESVDRICSGFPSCAVYGPASMGCPC